MAVKLRLLLAGLLSPLAAGLFGALISGLLSLLDAPATVVPTILFANRFIHWLPWITIAAFVILVLIGIPLHLLAKRMKVTSGVMYFTLGGTAAAALITLLAILTLGDLTDIEEAFLDALQFAMVGVPTGYFTAWIAWLIRRPDCDAPNPARATP
ncbi:hypothetical protein [Vitreimonas flagellata]|uniref:hypothetical protein n=1 Tax=Vitreimonas flagellata TaxID=2560861 RepID=UPI001074C422|nr:hypothetical protein [Vitreimonas flagellata]